MRKIAVIGAGTWGVVISDLLVKNGNEVFCYGRNKNQVDNLNLTHIHKNLIDIKLDESILFSSDLDVVLKDSDIVCFAVPSTAFRKTLNKIIKYINNDTYFISLTKGMEESTLFTMSEIVEEVFFKNNITNNNIVVLSGPTHAEEVGKKFPSTIVSASRNIVASKFIQDIFMNNYLRVYTNDDIKGVEICAAFKNVIALASGILFGLGYGDNIRAALITRGLAEMIRIGEKLDCKKDTFFGLAGIGDMIVTACSKYSRNFRCGEYIGNGFSVDEAIKKIGMVVESINFIESSHKLKLKYEVDLPISEGVYEIVKNNKSPKDILNLLMTREKKSE